MGFHGLCGRREQEGGPERQDSGFLGIRDEKISGSSTTNEKGWGLERWFSGSEP